VKYAIPLGALLALAVGVFLRQASLNKGAGRRVPDYQQGQVAEFLPELKFVDSMALIPTIVERTETQSSRPEIKPASVAASSSPGWRKLLSNLERGLTLSLVQKPRVEEILRQRDAEIQGCHDSIRKSGMLDVRAFEWEVARLKESWYRQVDALLDSAQHEQFVILVEKGLFNEGLAFTVDPGVTVLE